MPTGLTISSASIAANGRSLTVNVGGIVTGPLKPVASSCSGFTVTDTTTGLTQTCAVTAQGSSTVTCTLPYQVNTGDAITISYAPGTLTDSAGSATTMAAQGPISVTNSSTAVAPNLTNIAAYDFSSLPGLKAWYKANSIAGSDGDLISSWTDSSGNGNTLTAAGGSRPTLKLTTNGIGGVAALSFAGGQSISKSSLADSSYSTSFTVYIISKQVAGGSGFVFSFNTNNLGFWRGQPASPINVGWTALPPPTNSATTSETALFDPITSNLNFDDESLVAAQSAVYDGTNFTIDSQGHFKTQANTGAITLTGAFAVGSRSPGDFNFSGLIAEMIICNQAHSQSLRLAVESALSLKYSKTLYNQLVTEGDSITAGAGGTPMATNLLSDLSAGTYFTINAATSGYTLVQMLARGAAYVDPYDKVSGRKRYICSIFGGTNDLNDSSTSGDGTTVYNNLVKYCQLRRAAGWRTVVFTILPRYTIGGGFITASQACNALVRANWQNFADAIADVAADASMGQAGQNLPLIYTLTLASSGTTTFNFNGGNITIPASGNTSSSIQTQIVGMTGVGSGNVTVTGSGPYTVTFNSASGNTGSNAIFGNSSSFTLTTILTAGDGIPTVSGTGASIVYVSGGSLFPQDETHPSNLGEQVLTGYIQQCILGGSAYRNNIAQTGIDNGLFAGALTAPVSIGTSSNIFSYAAPSGGVSTYSMQLQRAPNVVNNDGSNNYDCPGTFANTGSANTSSTGTLTDTGSLTAGTKYWWRVQVTDSTGGTPLVNYSNILNGIPVAPASGFMAFFN